MLNADIIHNSFIFFFSITIIIKVALLLLNIYHIKQNFGHVPSEFADIIKLEDHQKAQNYTVTKNKFSLFGLFLHGAILLCWLETGILNTLYDFIVATTDSSVYQGVLFIFAFSIINSVISIPEAIYNTFVIVICSLKNI